MTFEYDIWYISRTCFGFKIGYDIRISISVSRVIFDFCEIMCYQIVRNVG